MDGYSGHGWAEYLESAEYPLIKLAPKGFSGAAEIMRRRLCGMILERFYRFAILFALLALSGV